MDFSKIISRAWNIVKTRRYLWYLGILAASAEGSSGSGSWFRLPASSAPTESPQNIDKSSVLLDKVPQVLGTTDNKIDTFFSNTSNISNYWFIIIIIVGLIILLGILVVYLANSSRAGLIISVFNLEAHKKEETFASAFHKGNKFAWRLFGLDILIGLIIIAFIIAISAPLAIAIIYNLGTGAYIFTGIIAFVGALALIFLVIYLSILSKIASRAMVIDNLKILPAFRQARHLIDHDLKNNFLTWLINFGIGLAYSIVLFFIIIIVLAMLIGPGFIASLAGTGALIGYVIIFGLIFFAATLVVGGIYTSFTSAYWTIAYRAIEYINKKDK